MSYLFEHRDEPLWEPSLEVARLLLATTSHLENRLGIESGLIEYMSDTIEVDFDALSGFLITLRDWANLDNQSINLLIKPIYVHLFALLHCAGASTEGAERGYPADWIDEARHLARTNMRPAGAQNLAGRRLDRTAM